MGRSRILQNKILRRNTGADTTIRLDAITPGEKILMVHNPKNPAYRRICDAVISHGKLYYVLKSSPRSNVRISTKPELCILPTGG